MARKARIIIGLNSGTSADGIDAAACEITGRGAGMRVRVLGHLHRAYPTELRRRVLAVMAPSRTQTEELCRLESEIGLVFARTAAALVRKLGRRRVDLIGSHGQTICHLPPRDRGSGSGGSLQIGDPAMIAVDLRTPVVSHFRQADLAVGGQGAPLVPWTDYVLFQDSRRHRIVQNIGGIANLTWLPAGGLENDVRAFDAGPGNMVIDSLVRHYTRGRESFDRNGQRAEAGVVLPEVLREMLRHPYLRREPPKSCGREEFGDSWTASLLRRFARCRYRPEDWIATATFFSAWCMFDAYCRLSARERRPRGAYEIILCGGGARNRVLVGHVRDWVRMHPQFASAAVVSIDRYGISSQAKECVSFAMLAAARVDGVPANLPGVTGARRRVILGQVCDPEGRL